ncbi:MAG: hypothetical protein KGL70_10210 [Betaproteobacteria bacterium]|nr:hypothetical protein [Betaproteobacteria bacterium]MDE2003996.1 hypothetical protein [Betaproteobacteria bacterium]MDE2359746.1 hypothetical protein [Betaproteobacteria bacterium]
MKPHPDIDLRQGAIAQLLRRLSWRRLDRSTLVMLRLALLCAALLVAIPWLIAKGPIVMSPAVPAFTQAAEDGRVTLHAAAVEARPAVVLRRKSHAAPE